MFQLSERSKKWIMVAVVVFALPTVGISITPGAFGNRDRTELASFEVRPGKRVVITNEEYRNTMLRINNLSRRNPEPSEVWNHIILVREAEEAGIMVTDDEIREVVDRFAEQGADVYARAVRAQYNMTTGQFEQQLREQFLVRRLQEVYRMAQRYPTEQLFEEFKKDAGQKRYELDYVAYRADDLIKKQNPLDYPLEKVREYYTASGNDHVRRKYLGQDKYDVEFVAGRFDQLDPAKTPEKFAQVAFRDDAEEQKELEAFHQQNQHRYRRPQTEIKPGEQDTTKELYTLAEIRPQVKREALITRLVERARADELLQGEKPDVRAVARKYGLTYGRSGPMTTPELTGWTELGDPQAQYAVVSAVSTLQDGKLQDAVNKSVPGQVFFVRLRERLRAEPPPLEEVELRVREDLMRKDAYDQALAAARDFRKAMEDAAKAELEPGYQAIRDHRAKEAEEEITRDKIEDEEGKKLVREKYKGRAELEITKKREADFKAKELAAFDKVAADRGLAVKHLAPFTRRQYGVTMPGEDPAEAFLKSNITATSLRSKGEVSSPIPDELNKAVYLVRATDVQEPTADQLDDQALPNARRGLDTRQNIQMQAKFDYKIGLKTRVNLESKVPEEEPERRGTPITPETPIEIPVGTPGDG